MCDRETLYLVGGLEHSLFFHILGMSSSQLTFIFFRGVGLNHQPVMTHDSSWFFARNSQPQPDRNRACAARCCIKVPSTLLMSLLHVHALPWTWLAPMETLGLTLCEGRPQSCPYHIQDDCRVGSFAVLELEQVETHCTEALPKIKKSEFQGTERAVKPDFLDLSWSLFGEMFWTNAHQNPSNN